MLDSLLSIGHHAAGIIPDSMQVEIVNTLAQGHADGFQAMIDWCEATQSKAILGGTLTSQTGANGNRSLGDVHNEVRLDIRNDDAAKLDRSLSDYLIYPLAVINGLTSADRAPRFTSDTQEPDDLALYADALPKLVSIGAQIPLSYLHEKLKIPEPEGDEPVLGAPGEARGGAGQGGRGEGGVARRNVGASFSPRIPWERGFSPRRRGSRPPPWPLRPIPIPRPSRR